MDFSDLDFTGVFEFRAGIPKIEDNPLLISVILNRLFDYCSKSDYKNCRRVCRKWRDELHCKWREQMWLVFAEDNNTKRITQGQMLHLRNPNFTPGDPYHLVERPYENIHTINFNLTSLQKSYWGCTGSTIKKLHLEETYIFDTNSFQQLLFEWTPNLEEFRYTRCNFYKFSDPNAPPPIVPRGGNNDDVLTKDDTLFLTSPNRRVQPNLKVLSIVSHIRLMDKETFPISWVVLFGKFPNVEKLALKNFLKATELIQILKIIAAIRHISGTDVLNIKEFDLGRSFQSTSFAPTVITQLETLPFPLVSLTAKLQKDVTHQNLEDLLVRYSSTLIELTVERRYDCDPYNTFRYQIFGNLTKLKLLGPMFATWDFLKFAPSLKELVVRNPNGMGMALSSDYEHEHDDQNMWPMLEQLRIFEYTGTIIQHQVTRQLSMITPNVIEVNLWVEAMSFDLVCKNWSNLRHATFGKLLVPETKFTKCLRRLKDLRTIQLPKHVMIGFSDHVIFYGFMKMKRLEKISVIFPAIVSDAALKLLDEGIWNTRDVRVDVPFRYFNMPCKKDLEDQDSDLD